MAKKEENFESKLQDLEKIVSELEKGDLSLEDTVKKFEVGMKISKECSQLLEKAEKKISVILECNDENIQEEEIESI